MSSPRVEDADNGTPQPEAVAFADRAEATAPRPARVSSGERLRSVSRWTPLTWMLVAANVTLFVAMALCQGKLVGFHAHVLLAWGGGLAPRVFSAEWWRAGSYMFVHADLNHLASNLLFLLLIARLMERLLGSIEFAVVYLFAGLGGGLLFLGTAPQHVLVGSSAAVYGIYGALLGCCLRATALDPLAAHRAAPACSCCISP